MKTWPIAPKLGFLFDILEPVGEVAAACVAAVVIGLVGWSVLSTVQKRALFGSRQRGGPYKLQAARFPLLPVTARPPVG